MELKYFKDFDFSSFWDDSEYSIEDYLDKPPSDDLILTIEKKLGYKFPDSYIEFMKLHNGGIPFKNCFATNEETSWAEDHIAIEGFLSIGKKKENSLCGEGGSQFMIDHWDYPDIGIYICDCPSAGHDMILMDYSKCGKNGEPEIVHVDQGLDYKKTILAKDFELFVRGLVSSEQFDDNID